MTHEEKLLYLITYLIKENPRYAGVEIPLEFGQNKKANNDEGAIAASVFYVVGGAFMKGKNVIISEGTRFDAMVAVDTDLEATIENLAEVMSEDKNDSTKITIH